MPSSPRRPGRSVPTAAGNTFSNLALVLPDIRLGDVRGRGWSPAHPHTSRMQGGVSDAGSIKTTAWIEYARLCKIMLNGHLRSRPRGADRAPQLQEAIAAQPEGTPRGSVLSPRCHRRT